MSWVFVALIGCVSFHHHIEAGWISGPVDGQIDHGGMAAYTISMTIDDDIYAIGGGGQFWGTRGTHAAGTVGADVWTDTLDDAPIGLRGQGMLLVHPDSPIFLPLGVALRGGPYLSLLDDDLWFTVTGHGQLSLLGEPLANWGALGGVRWPVGALWNPFE